jgi:hypothetical protein
MKIIFKKLRTDYVQDAVASIRFRIFTLSSDYSFVLYYTGMKVKEEHRLRASGNAMLRRIFYPRGRKYRRMEDSLTYIPSFIICNVLFTQHYQNDKIKKDKMEWTYSMAHMWEMRIAQSM